MNIIIYTQDSCGYCDAAKKELDQRGWDYSTHNIKDEDNKQALLELLPNVKTVPQIWIDNKHIGGYYDLITWFEDEWNHWSKERRAKLGETNENS